MIEQQTKLEKVVMQIFLHKTWMVQFATARFTFTAFQLRNNLKWNRALIWFFWKWNQVQPKIFSSIGKYSEATIEQHTSYLLSGVRKNKSVRTSVPSKKIFPWENVCCNEHEYNLRLSNQSSEWIKAFRIFWISMKSCQNTNKVHI